ncbi:MAG: hypothetical protein EXR50_05960 [Dehalococcoidia bacterium]|nr:hypothetical protein [Dehalococcoidia bacterium]
MLGDKVGEAQGKITGRRVLPSTGGGPVVETSYEAAATHLGIKATDIGTYKSVARPDGTLWGEGQGVLMGAGGEMATWVGTGVGHFTSTGGISFRGAVYYQSSSPAWARLNTVAAVYEHEIDASGNASNQIWEWK